MSGSGAGTPPSAYREAGVDIDEGLRAVSLLADAVAATRRPEVLSEVGSFGGLFAADALGPGKVLVASTDGVGTKVELAARLGRWHGIGVDLVNHCVDDILVQGASPLFFCDYVAAARLVAEDVAAIVTGMADACRHAGCALLGGETAEMPGVYVAGAVDVAGTIVGVVDRDALWPRSDEMAAGDALVAMASSGPHTNGYTLIRALLERRGVDLADDPELADELLAPHRNHRPDVDALIARGVIVKGLAHITGGGFLDNIPRILPPGLGAEITLGTWEVPPVFRRLVDWGEIDDEEAFRVWNMGVGMVAVVPADAADATGLPVIGRLVAHSGGPRVLLTGSWR
ncbi:MAG: phosphoribosylformylglycinamidine cyclo-ligase [Actinomyces sp.]|nr:MAG: phosphoribosylformylglycinamidine cyclo-ligase [Actinomyces sp.]